MPTDGFIPPSPAVFGFRAGKNLDVGLNGPGCVTSFGHSYLDPTAGISNPNFSTQGGLVNSDQSLFRQILAALGLQESRAINYAVSTSCLIMDNSSTVTGAKGGHVQVLQSISPINIRQSNAGFRAPFTSNSGLVLLCWGINDIVAFAGGSQNARYRNLFKEAWRTVISRCRAAAVYEALTDTNTAFSGGGLGGAHWSSVASTTVNSGTGFARTATVGATATLTIPNDYDGNVIGVGFIGRKGAIGGQATVTIDGVIVDAIDTSNVTADSVGKDGVTTRSGLPIVLTRRYTLQPRVAHTIVITTTGIDTNFDYNFYNLEASEGNPIIPFNTPKLRSYSAPGQGNMDYLVDDWNNALEEVCKEFTEPLEIANLDDAVNQSATQVNYINGRIAYDNIHLSELGARYGAAAVLDAYIRLTQTASLVQTTTNQRDTVGTGFYIPVAPTVANQYVVPGACQPDGTGLPLTASSLYAIPYVVTRPCTIRNVVFDSITAAGGGGLVQVGMMHDKGNSLILAGTVQGPLQKMYDWGQLTATVATPKIFAIPAGQGKIIVPGLIWLILIPQAGVTVTMSRIASPHPYVNSSSFGQPRPVAGTGYIYTIGGGFTVIPASITPLTSTQVASQFMPYVGLDIGSVP